MMARRSEMQSRMGFYREDPMYSQSQDGDCAPETHRLVAGLDHHGYGYTGTTNFMMADAELELTPHWSNSTLMAAGNPDLEASTAWTSSSDDCYNLQSQVMPDWEESQEESQADHQWHRTAPRTRKVSPHRTVLHSVNTRTPSASSSNTSASSSVATTQQRLSELRSVSQSQQCMACCRTSTTGHGGAGSNSSGYIGSAGGDSSSAVSCTININSESHSGPSLTTVNVTPLGDIMVEHKTDHARPHSYKKTRTRDKPYMHHDSGQARGHRDMDASDDGGLLQDSMQVSRQEIMNRLAPDIETYMQARVLLPHLLRHQLLTREDEEYLCHHARTETECNRFVRRLIQRKPPEDFEKFISALKEESEHTGHAHLAKLLQAAYNRKISEPFGKLRVRNHSSPTLMRTSDKHFVAAAPPKAIKSRKQSLVSANSNSEALDNLLQRKLQWLQNKVEFKNCQEVIVFTSKTHFEEQRTILYDGTLHQKGKARFVVLCTDFLLVMKVRKSHEKFGIFSGSHQRLDWFCDHCFKASEPILLHQLSIGNPSKKQGNKTSFCLHYKNNSQLEELCLQACSEEAMKVWLSFISDAIESCTTKAATSQPPIKSRVSSKKEKFYQQLSLTLVCASELLPKIHDQCHPFCLVKVNHCYKRTPTLRNTTSPEWNCTLDFHDFKKPGKVFIELYNEKLYAPDDLLGNVEVPIAGGTISEEKVMKRSFALENAKKGQITLQIQLGSATKL